MEEYKIYTLNDPETGEVRYVGKTISPLYKRLSSHYRDKKHSYKTNWITKLKEKNLKPIINLIEICDENNWEEREKYWIAYYRKHSKLTNYLDGGQGQQKGYKHTDEAKEKIRLASIQNTKGKFYKGQCFETEINKKRAESNKKNIYQYSIDGVLIKKWDGIIDASNELKINKNNIISVLKGKTLTAGGYIWSHHEKVKVLNKKSNTAIIVTNVNTNETKEFNSIAQCVKILNIERKHIENSLRSNSVKFGYKFKRK